MVEPLSPAQQPTPPTLSRSRLVRQADRDFGRAVYAQHQEAVQAVIDRVGEPLRIEATPRRKRHRLFYGVGHGSMTVEVATRREFAGRVLKYKTETRARVDGRWLPLGCTVKAVRLELSAVAESREMQAEVVRRAALGEGGVDSLRQDLRRLSGGGGK